MSSGDPCQTTNCQCSQAACQMYGCQGNKPLPRNWGQAWLSDLDVKRYVTPPVPYPEQIARIGCICPPTSEQTCQRADCGRKTANTQAPA